MLRTPPVLTQRASSAHSTSMEWAGYLSFFMVLGAISQNLLFSYIETRSPWKTYQLTLLWKEKFGTDVLGSGGVYPLAKFAQIDFFYAFVFQDLIFLFSYKGETF